VRSILWTSCFLVLVALVSVRAQGGDQASRKPDQFVGTWSGTWEGAGSSGNFELSLEQPKDGPLTCKVTVTNPDYKATCRSVSFDGKKMTAKYDYPPDERGEVELGASFEGMTVKGTWALQAKGTTTAAASGTWTVTKK
jgi:hypothetical protein